MCAKCRSKRNLRRPRPLRMNKGSVSFLLIVIIALLSTLQSLLGDTTVVYNTDRFYLGDMLWL